MLDAMSIVFWSITYILVSIFNIKNRSNNMLAMPLLPTILNFSWELNALVVSQGFWGHVAWLCLDVFVIFSCVILIKEKKKTILYLLSILLGIIIFYIVFRLGLMLESSFVINAIMSICFWINRKNILTEGKTAISITKGLGTISATIYYASYSLVVGIVGFIIAVIDIMYALYCIDEKKKIKHMQSL